MVSSHCFPFTWNFWSTEKLITHIIYLGIFSQKFLNEQKVHVLHYLAEFPQPPPPSHLKKKEKEDISLDIAKKNTA